MVAASAVGRAMGESGTDRALRVTVSSGWAEVVGAVLMDLLGSFEQEAPAEDDPNGTLTLIFYPGPTVDLTLDDIVAALPPEIPRHGSGAIRIETRTVSRDWVEGWRAHFLPVVIGAVRIRPPWEPELKADDSEGLVDVVINPGLGFGTGQHPTTRGVLQLLQGQSGDEAGPFAEWSLRPPGGPVVDGPVVDGPVVDVGTGSGVLAIAAAKLGWRPIIAFDNDAAALVSARSNIVANGIEGQVQVYEIEVAETPTAWFEGATVLANMTLEPVSVLLQKVGAGAGGPARVLVSGILAGSQEHELLQTARESGFVPGARICEDEWVSLELLPMSLLADGSAVAADKAPPAGTSAGEGRD